MCSYLEALKKYNACESCFAYKVGYVNSSNFWWNLCFLFCLYFVYLLKIFISLSIYELAILIYFLVTLKYQNTCFEIFLCLKQKWRATKGVVPALSVNLCVPYCTAMAIISCDSAIIFQCLNVYMQSPQMTQENFFLWCLREEWETIVTNWMS